MVGNVDYGRYAAELGEHLDDVRAQFVHYYTALQMLRENVGDNTGVLGPAELALERMVQTVGGLASAQTVEIEDEHDAQAGLIAAKLDSDAGDARELDREPQFGRIINNHTLQIGNTYIPLFGRQRAILGILSRAAEPVSFADIDQRLGDDRGEHQVIRTRIATRELAAALNAVIGPETLRIDTSKREHTVQIDHAVLTVKDVSEAAPEVRTDGQDLYAGIVPVPSYRQGDPKSAEAHVIEIVEDRKILINGRPVSLRGNTLFMFNALMLLNGFASPKEIQALGFAHDAPQKFTEPVQALEERTNRGLPASSSKIVLSAGNRSSILYGFGPNVIFVDRRSAEPPRDSAEPLTGEAEDARDLAATAGGAAHAKAGAHETARVEEFEKLVTAYHKVVSRYVNATDDELRAIAQLETTIANELSSEDFRLDNDTVRDMLVMARISAVLRQDFGPGRSPEPIPFAEHRDAVFGEMNQLLQIADISPLRLAVSALHIGLPPDKLPLLRDLVVKKPVTYVEVSYADLYAWTRTRSGEFVHLQSLFYQNRDTKGVRSIFRDTAEHLRLRLAASNTQR